MNRKKRMDSSEKNQPAAEFRINGVKAVVWQNETRNGSMFNTTLVRVYKDKDDEWQETSSLGRDDLLATAAGSRGQDGLARDTVIWEPSRPPHRTQISPDASAVFMDVLRLPRPHP